MKKSNVQRGLADRVEAIFNPIADPVVIEKFGSKSITVSDSIDHESMNGFYLRKLVKEFEYVHLIDGQLVVSD